jgi:hypothetical protein
VQTTVGGAATDYLFNAAGQRVSEWNGAAGAQLVAFYANGATHFVHQDCGAPSDRSSSLGW